MREPIVIGWNEWLASRAAKRANLRLFGLDAPSRRETDYGTSGRRLRAAFGGLRAPRLKKLAVWKCSDVERRFT